MKKRPTVALIYDFDGTLSPGNMQEFGFIQAIGKTPDEFWRQSNQVPEGQEVSSILSYMKLMIDEARENGSNPQTYAQANWASACQKIWASFVPQSN